MNPARNQIRDPVGKQRYEYGNAKGRGQIPKQTIGAGTGTGFLLRKSGQGYLHKNCSVSPQAKTENTQRCHQNQD